MIDWRDPDGRPNRGLSTVSALRWGAAIVVVVAVHGGAVWAALSWKSAHAAAGEPPPAVMIELAPMAVAPEAVPQDVAPGPQMTEAQPEPALDTPEKPLDKPIEEVPAPQPQIEIPKLPEKPNAEAVLAPPPKEQTKPPPPKVKKAERKKPIDPDKPKTERTTAPMASPNPRADSAAAPSSSASMSSSASPASWRGEMMAHLNRYKRFPSGASIGTATVAFAINRAGQVLSARLVGSSGDPLLDAEAVSLPRRASPVPVPPPGMGGASITLSVPIRFNR